MKRVLMTLAVCSIVFLSASVAPAAKPVKFSSSGAGSGWIGDCPEGFEVWEAVSYEVNGKDYYNNDGEYLRSKAHWTVEGIVFNADSPDNYLPYQNSVYNEFFDGQTGEFRVAGLWALVTVPGFGSIFMDVGLIVFDADFNITFEAGKHQWWNSNVEELCAFLADGG